MPKTKYAQRIDAMLNRHKPLIKLILGTMKMDKITWDDLCAATGKSKSTLERHLKNPRNLTLGERDDIARRLNISDEDIARLYLKGGMAL